MHLKPSAPGPEGRALRQQNLPTCSQTGSATVGNAETKPDPTKNKVVSEDQPESVLWRPHSSTRSHIADPTLLGLTSNFLPGQGQGMATC